MYHRVQRPRLILHGSDESAAPAHHEISVPVIGQQQLEIDLGLDHTSDAAVCRGGITRRDGLGRCNTHVDQLDRGERAAPVVANRGGRRLRWLTRTGSHNGEPSHKTQRSGDLDHSHRILSATL